jgi:hypothetical protein
MAVMGVLSGKGGAAVRQSGACAKASALKKLTASSRRRSTS